MPEPAATVPPVQPLTILHEHPDGRIGFNGRPARPPLVGAHGEFYGHEWAKLRRDTLDEATDRLIAQQPAGPVTVLDIGCASGARAAEFARAGCTATAIDIVDRAGAIEARNRTLGAEASQVPPIAFIQADLRALGALDLSSSFDLVHARRVINFVAMAALPPFFAAAAGLLRPGGALVISLTACDLREPERAAPTVPSHPARSVEAYPGLFFHPFSSVRCLVETAGFRVSCLFSDGLVDAGLIALRG